MTLAVVDWGIGGLGFLRPFAARHPDVPVVYLSDTGFTPYGKVPRRVLAARVDAVLRRLAEVNGARHAVLACNAASTVLGDLRASREMEIVGVIEPGVAALAALPPMRVGVIGGRRTVTSGAWGRGLRRAGHRVRQRVAQPLSAHVEAGRLDTEDVRADVARILAPLRSAEVLVMACTHYPALAPLLTAECPRATLFDPVSATLTHVERAWPLAPGDGRHCFLTTGDPAAMRRSARLAFGVELEGIEAISI